MSMEFQTMAGVGMCLLASVTEVMFARGQNPKNPGQGQRQIESPSVLVIDIRKGDLHVTEFKRKKIAKSVTHDTKSITGDTALICKAFFERNL